MHLMSGVDGMYLIIRRAIRQTWSRTAGSSRSCRQAVMNAQRNCKRAGDVVRMSEQQTILAE